MEGEREGEKAWFSMMFHNYSLVLLFCAQGWLPPENEETKQQDFQARGCHPVNKKSMQLLQVL